MANREQVQPTESSILDSTIIGGTIGLLFGGPTDSTVANVAIGVALDQNIVRAAQHAADAIEEHQNGTGKRIPGR